MSPHLDPIVETFVQRRFKLESLLEEQSAVIRKEPGYQEVYERNTHDFATKPGDYWAPVDAADKDKKVKEMEEMCAKIPT
jgi:hypothetical protein